MRRQKDEREPIDMLQGTLDMLILRTLLMGPAHGHQIAKHLQRTTDDVLQVEHGSLYPALHRLEDLGLIAAFWGTSENSPNNRSLISRSPSVSLPWAGEIPYHPKRRARGHPMQALDGCVWEFRKC